MNEAITNYGIRRHPRGGYGQYEVFGVMNGIEIAVHSTNSEAFDYWRDEDRPEKQQEALNYIKRRIEARYEELAEEAQFFISISWGDNTEYFNSFEKTKTVKHYQQSEGFITYEQAEEALEKLKVYGKSQGWNVSYAIENWNHFPYS